MCENGFPPWSLPYARRYVDEVSLFSVFMDIAPTLLLLGGTYWLVSRQMRQMTGGMGGFGGMGGRGGLGGRAGRGGASGPGGFFGMVSWLGVEGAGLVKGIGYAWEEGNGAAVRYCVGGLRRLMGWHVVSKRACIVPGVRVSGVRGAFCRCKVSSCRMPTRCSAGVSTLARACTRVPRIPLPLILISLLHAFALVVQGQRVLHGQEQGQGGVQGRGGVRRGQGGDHGVRGLPQEP